jgi:hypothetical protein
MRGFLKKEKTGTKRDVSTSETLTQPVTYHSLHSTLSSILESAFGNAVDILADVGSSDENDVLNALLFLCGGQESAQEFHRKHVSRLDMPSTVNCVICVRNSSTGWLGLPKAAQQLALAVKHVSQELSLRVHLCGHLDGGSVVLNATRCHSAHKYVHSTLVVNALLQHVEQTDRERMLDHCKLLHLNSDSSLAERTATRILRDGTASLRLFDKELTDFIASHEEAQEAMTFWSEHMDMGGAASGGSARAGKVPENAVEVQKHNDDLYEVL